MTRIEIEATFDGSVFRPTGPVPTDLPPNARVRIIWDDLPPVPEDAVIGKPGSFLRVLSEARLEGPPDWASNPEKYLRGPHGD